MGSGRRIGSEGYSGYYRTRVPRETVELTHVGPGTPCGEYLRRSWQPVALASELGDRPRAVRILGEDLVAFRDRGGRVGVLHRHCSHRGASLEYGILMERGISCCYHGWHYDVDGTLLDTPGEPPDSPLRRRVAHGAYPAREYRGLVFAYLGPPEARPPFRVYDTFEMGDAEMVPFWLVTPCNWLQVIENTQDPVHTVFLHTRASGAQFDEAWGELQILDYYETPIGMFNCQTRRWGDHVWVRTTETILPNANQTGAIWERARDEKFFARVSLSRWMVPIDDTHTLTIGWRYFSEALDPEGRGDRTKVGPGTIDFVGQYEDRPYEERQRQPGDYEVQVSQRPIAIHALEHLGATDRGVALWRRLVRRGIRAVKAGGPGAGGARAGGAARAADTTPEADAAPAPRAAPPVGAASAAGAARAADGTLAADGTVPTYTQDTIVRMPARGPDDREVLRELGRRVARVVLDTAGLSHAERAARLRALREPDRAGPPPGGPAGASADS